jgi:hypothetical protein
MIALQMKLMDLTQTQTQTQTLMAARGLDLPSLKPINSRLMQTK